MANVGIPNPTWLALLGRLGIQRFGQWALGDLVVPVALVDAESVTLTASALSPLFGTPASAGEVVNPAAGTRLADTGNLAAGNWSLLIWFTQNTAGGVTVRVRRRNAADTADIWSQLWHVNTLSAASPTLNLSGRFSCALNESFVFENVDALVGTLQASIFAVQG